jgi:cytochrome b561
MATRTQYSGLQIALHWGIAVLIAINWFTGEAMITAFDGMIDGEAGKASLQSSLHIYLGLAVFFLALARLVLRIVQGKPAAADKTPGLLNKMAEAAHWLLYGLMVAVPFLGGLAWYRGMESAGDLHVLVMNGMLILIGIHAVAGLFHHYVIKDGLLSRMIPALRA